MSALQQEVGEIEAVIRNYLDGMIFADAAKLRKAFHPGACIIGHFDDNLEWLSLESFISSCERAGSAPANEPFYWEILSADVTGDVGVIRLADDYMGKRFTDYLSLLRHEGQWQIVNKTFFVHP